MEGAFPLGFWWGTGASSPQTEGAAPASNYKAFEHAGRVPPSGNGNGFATRYAEDFALYKQYGLTHHRLGIEWARIEPEEGRRDDEAMALYEAMLTSARERGIEAWVCLHHFVLPAWLPEDGFCDAHVRDYYWRRHLEFLAATYGDLVFGWKPINEPIAYAAAGFLAGEHPPGSTDIARFALALEGAHLANLVSWQVLRQTGKPVATVHALQPLFPADDSKEVATVTQLVDDSAWGCWIRAIRDGVLHVPGREAIDVPEFGDAFDLIGFSYYSASKVASPLALLPYPDGARVGPMGYAPWSEGLGVVLDRLAYELPGKPLLIALPIS